jgi:hypothetical protein
MTDDRLPDFEAAAEAGDWFDTVDLSTVPLSPARALLIASSVELEFEGPVSFS